MKRKLFNEFEVRATLDWHKTQFREVIKPQPKELKKYTLPLHATNWYDGDTLTDIKMPYKVGDRLWVAETWAQSWYRPITDLEPAYFYRANYQPLSDVLIKWKPSVQMQKQASRIILEVTGVKVERLNKISEQDAIAEGIHPATAKYQSDLSDWSFDVIGEFIGTWDSTNGKKHPWQSNPWVWVIDYKVVEVK